TGASGHTVDSKEHRPPVRASMVPPASLSLACKGPTGPQVDTPVKKRTRESTVRRFETRSLLRGEGLVEGVVETPKTLTGYKRGVCHVLFIRAYSSSTSLP